VVRRVSVVGVSGAGKTTLAAQIARGLGAPHLELDSVFHQPGWQPLAAEEFRARVDAFTAGDAWVIDGNYSSTVLDLIWQRADTVVWLDLPRHLAMRRLIGRTLRRTITRAELWNGNREPWDNFFRADPEKSVILWAWKHYHIYRARYSSAPADPENHHLTFVRLTSNADIARFLGRISAVSPADSSPPAPSGPNSRP
jgi:adenylate kinase family enzyme